MSGPVIFKGTNAQLIPSGNLLKSDGVTVVGAVDALTGHVAWTSGSAPDGTEYEILRNNSPTNQLQFNVPTGASMVWSINDSVILQMAATGAFSAVNTLTQNTSFTNLTSNLILNSAASNNGQYSGADIFVTPDGSLPIVNYTGQLNGIFVNAYTSEARTVGVIRGIKQDASNDGSTVTTLIGGDYQADQSAGSSSLMVAGNFNTFVDGGTCSAAYGVRINAIDGAIDPTVTTGLFVDTPLIGTTRWALAVGGDGNSYVEGTLNVGSAAAVTTSNTLQVTQVTATSGDKPSAFSIIGAAHTGLNNASGNAEVLFDLSNTVGFTGGGAPFSSTCVEIKFPTYSAPAAQALQFIVGLAVSGYAASAGSLTTNYSIGSLFGKIDGQSYAYGTQASVGVAIETPSIADGIGSLDFVAGLYMLGGGGKSLGNQTATLVDLNAIRLDACSWTSGTNVRTVTNPIKLLVNADTAGANVTFTNPALAIKAIGASAFAGLITASGDGSNVFEFPADNTGNATAAIGRVPVKIGGATKYLRYYND